MGGPRGRRIGIEERQNIISLIDEAYTKGARHYKACEVVGISERTLQRWRKTPNKEDGRNFAGQDREPANKLTDSEREKILTICNHPAYAHMTPHEIVPALADEGIYIASEASFYRVLRQAGQAGHRGKTKPPVNKRPEPVSATGPNQIWSWDITYLKTTVLGLFFYLYMIVDIYSRKIVGWEVYSSENSDNAADLFQKAYLREGITGDELTLHSDNGSPMKGATLLMTLKMLGVSASFSRPGVSNDNPYSEALFKTLKYQPLYPQKPFDTIEDARQWVADFVSWYNEVHLHSGIKFVTPGQRHRGEDIEILENRSQLYEQIKEARPERWSGAIRNWEPVDEVSLNARNSKRAKALAAAA